MFRVVPSIFVPLQQCEGVHRQILQRSQSQLGLWVLFLLGELIQPTNVGLDLEQVAAVLLCYVEIVVSTNTQLPIFKQPICRSVDLVNNEATPVHRDD